MHTKRFNQEAITGRLTQWHYWLLDHTDGWFAPEPDRVGKCTNDLMCPNSRHSTRCVAYTATIDNYCKRFGKI